MKREKAPGFQEPFSIGKLRRVKRIGVVLAGGLSSRMGTNKALLSLNGETLLERATRVLRQSGGEEMQVLVSGKQSVPDLVYVEDLEPGVGPLGGIASVIRFLRARVSDKELLDRECLVLPVDMPGVSSDLLATLWNRLQTGKAVHFANEPFPCSFRLTEGVLGFFEKEFPDLNESGRSPTRFLKSIGAESLPAPSGRALRSLNTREQWRAEERAEREEFNS